MMLVRRHCGVNKGTRVLVEEIILIKYIDKRRFFGVGGQKKNVSFIYANPSTGTDSKACDW